MKTIWLLLSALALAATVQAQNLNRAVQQAHRAADQTSARSGGGQPTAPEASSAPATPQAPPVDPAVAAMQQNVANLRANIASINAAADATAAAGHRIALLNNLSAAAQGQKASPENVRNLANDLIKALSGKNKLSAENSEKIARAIRAVSNGKQLGEKQQETLVADVKQILAEAGVTDQDAAKVAEDLNTIAAETR